MRPPNQHPCRGTWQGRFRAVSSAIQPEPHADDLHCCPASSGGASRLERLQSLLLLPPFTRLPSRRRPASERLPPKVLSFPPQKPKRRPKRVSRNPTAWCEERCLAKTAPPARWASGRWSEKKKRRRWRGGSGDLNDEPGCRKKVPPPPDTSSPLSGEGAAAQKPPSPRSQAPKLTASTSASRPRSLRCQLGSSRCCCCCSRSMPSVRRHHSRCRQPQRRAAAQEGPHHPPPRARRPRRRRRRPTRPAAPAATGRARGTPRC